MSVPLGPRRGTCGLLWGRASGRGRGGVEGGARQVWGPWNPVRQGTKGRESEIVGVEPLQTQRNFLFIYLFIQPINCLEHPLYVQLRFTEAKETQLMPLKNIQSSPVGERGM